MKKNYNKDQRKWMTRRLILEVISLAMVIVGVVLFFKYTADRKAFWDYAGVVIALTGGIICYYFYDESYIKYTKRKEPKVKKKISARGKCWIFRKTVIYIIALVVIFAGKTIMKFTEFPDIGFITTVVVIVLGGTFFLETFKNYKMYGGWWW